MLFIIVGSYEPDSDLHGAVSHREIQEIARTQDEDEANQIKAAHWGACEGLITIVCVDLDEIDIHGDDDDYEGPHDSDDM